MIYGIDKPHYTYKAGVWKMVWEYCPGAKRSTRRISIRDCWNGYLYFCTLTNHSV